MIDEMNPHQNINLAGCVEFVLYSRELDFGYIRVFWIITPLCSVQYFSHAHKILENHWWPFSIFIIAHSKKKAPVAIFVGYKFYSDSNWWGQTLIVKDTSNMQPIPIAFQFCEHFCLKIRTHPEISWQENSSDQYFLIENV